MLSKSPDRSLSTIRTWGLFSRDEAGEGRLVPQIGDTLPTAQQEDLVQEIDVDESAKQDHYSMRLSGAPKMLRSLARQARLIALACVIVDVIVFTTETPTLDMTVRIISIAVIIAVDAILALPPKYSAHIAVIHAVAIVGLAFVLHTTPHAEWALIGGMIAAYRVGSWLREKASAAALLILVIAAGFGGWIAYSATWLTMIVASIKYAFIPWLMGRYTSARRGHIEELRHNRELELRQATASVEQAEDRVRSLIAHDLHDVISHHVSAIGVHIGAARLKLAAKPEISDPEILDSFHAVETSARSAMVDLRRVLDVLHKKPDSTNEIGLRNLGELFEGVERSGLKVNYRLIGYERKLPGSLDTALYRVVQEMLTNALRSGDGTYVDVDLTFDDDSVSLSARNPIGLPSAHSKGFATGLGLAGIRSRIALFNGEVFHGPIDDGKIWETKVIIHTDTSLPGDTW